MNGVLISVFLFALLISAAINLIMIKFSVNLGVRNLSEKEEIRWQKRKPSVGGLSFYIAFLIFFAILSNLILIDNLKEISYSHKRDLSLIVATTLGFFVGLIDDAKNTNPLLKLLGQVLTGLILVSFGTVISFSPNMFWNSFITIIWVVFLMNSINMLDNMDGMTASISLAIFIAISSFSVNGMSLSSLMIMVCAGSVMGFLIYNWHPSRIYMGDSGSQFLGITLAYFSIVYLWGNRYSDGGYFQINQIYLPLLFFTIPIFDTTTVFIHRLLRRQSPFVGGKDHLSHHLVFLGLKDYQAVSLLLAIQILFIVLGFLTWHNSSLFGYVMLLWITSFCILQYMYNKAKALAPKMS